MGWLSSAISVVSSTVSTISSGISRFCSTVVPKIAPVLSQGVQVVRKFCDIAEKVLNQYQVLPPNEKIEVVGDRVIQASEQGIVPDNFARYDEYLETIRGFELDPKKTLSNELSDKIYTGLSVCSSALDEKLNMQEGTVEKLWVLTAKNMDYFNIDRMSVISETTDIKSIIDYFEGNLGPAKAVNAEKVLVTIEKTYSPEKDNQAIFTELDAIRRSVQ